MEREWIEWGNLGGRKDRIIGVGQKWGRREKSKWRKWGGRRKNFWERGGRSGKIADREEGESGEGEQRRVSGEKVGGGGRE